MVSSEEGSKGKLMATDLIGREINVDDFVYHYTYTYKVLSVGPSYISAMIHPQSKTSKKKSICARECCLLPKDDVLLWILKNGKM